MVTIRTSYEDFKQLLGKDVSVEEIDDLIAFAKSEVDAYNEYEDELEIDCKTSNRPDLWCAEGLIREVNGILEKQKGIPEIELKPSGVEVQVDQKLKKSRPYIACAVVKNLELSDHVIKQLMQLSEKIDLSYGRRRKRTSIGMYNLSMIQSPVHYSIVNKDYKFVPLGFTEALSVEKIIDAHPKGQEYGSIVKTYGHYPILESDDGVTLSMPPIINSNDVGRVTESTKECLLEVTGINYDAVNVVLNVLCQTLADRGAKIYSVEIQYPKEIREEIDITPNLKPEEITVKLDDINSYLGINLSTKKLVDLMEKRRFNAKGINQSAALIFIPPYRDDILHWVDISEEIAIALDYNKIGTTNWAGSTIGGLMAVTESENVVRDIMIGAGATEVLTNILTDPDILTKNVNIDVNDFVEIENPVVTTYSVIRDKIFPSLINLLSKNTHEEYPQSIFEVGEVVTMIGERLATKTNVAYLYADAEASFESAHKLIHHLFKLLDVDYQLETSTHASFIEGRCGKIIVKGKECGMIGEIHPTVLEKNAIWVPIAGFEIDLSEIPTLDCKRRFTY